MAVCGSLLQLPSLAAMRQPARVCWQWWPWRLGCPVSQVPAAAAPAAAEPAWGTLHILHPRVHARGRSPAASASMYKWPWSLCWRRLVLTGCQLHGQCMQRGWLPGPGCPHRSQHSTARAACGHWVFDSSQGHRLSFGSTNLLLKLATFALSQLVLTT